MALTIPNEGSATYSDQAEPDAVDFDILVAGDNLTGVLTGCAVTQRGAGANMSVDVASGAVIVGGTRVAVSSTNVAVGAADATNPRFDLVTINNAGTVAVTAGTAAANAVFPAIPANSVVVAALYVPANAASVVTAQIVDKRVVVAPGGLIGSVAFTNASNYSTTSTSLADVDATNLAVTFVAPASGKVIFSVSCLGFSNANDTTIGVRESTTNVVSRKAQSGNQTNRGHYRFPITGLTAGSSHTYKLAWFVNSGTSFIFNQEVLLEVWAAA